MCDAALLVHRVVIEELIVLVSTLIGIENRSLCPVQYYSAKEGRSRIIIAFAFIAKDD